MFSLISSDATLLVDNEGEVVHTRPGAIRAGLSVWLLGNGILLRTLNIGQGGIESSGDHVQRVAFDGSVLWDYDYLSQIIYLIMMQSLFQIQ